VKAVEEADELLTTGRVHREFQVRLDCFSAAVGEVVRVGDLTGTIASSFSASCGMWR
jgi:hypothetical protein